MLLTHQIGIEHTGLYLIYIDLTDMDGKGIGHASQEIVQHGTLTMYLAQMHGDGLRLEQTHEDGQATSALFLAQQGDIELIVRCLLQ